jgi:signal transduction histidine kinase
MVSHEFRTPLAVIQSSSDLLLHYGERMTDMRRREQLGEIHTQVRHLTGLLEDILTLNQFQAMGRKSLTRQPVNLKLLAAEITREIQQTARAHSILLSETGDADEVMLDPKLIRQVIGNLLNNAVKYSDPGSRVWFMLDSQPEQAILTFKDEGIGIPEEDQEHLFNTFHRGRNVGVISGTGLGLAIVKQAVEAHDGTISCESEPGVGTTFTVRIPYRALGED